MTEALEGRDAQPDPRPGQPGKDLGQDAGLAGRPNVDAALDRRISAGDVSRAMDEIYALRALCALTALTCHPRGVGSRRDWRAINRLVGKLEAAARGYTRTDFNARGALETVGAAPYLNFPAWRAEPAEDPQIAAIPVDASLESSSRG